MVPAWHDFEADLLALEEQLRLAKKWQGQIVDDFEEYNKLIAQLEDSLYNLTARADKGEH